MTKMGDVPSDSNVTVAGFTEMPRIEVQTNTDQSPAAGGYVDFGSSKATVTSVSSNGAALYDGTGAGMFRTLGYPGLFIIGFDLVFLSNSNWTFNIERNGVFVQQIGREASVGASRLPVMFDEVVKIASPGVIFKLQSVQASTVLAGSRAWACQVA